MGGAPDEQTSISITDTGSLFELSSNLGQALAAFGADIQPEGLPTRVLRTRRYALTGVPDRETFESDNKTVFTIADTGGCSCEQIIARLGLGGGQTRYGCSKSALSGWIIRLSP